MTALGAVILAKARIYAFKKIFMPIENEDDRINAEIDEISAESKEAIAEAKSRIGDIAITEEVLQTFLGKGLAHEMPLGETIGFLDAEEDLPEEKRIVRPQEIETAKEMLLAAIGESELTEHTLLHEVFAHLVKEKERLAPLAETELERR